METDTLTAGKAIDYRKTAEAILSVLKQERDREIVARRFGLGIDRRHTLEKIGQAFGITRERVRQIEKSATAKLMASQHQHIKDVDAILSQHLARVGHIAPLREVTEAIGAKTPAERAYVTFLATLAPSIEVIDENDYFHAAIASLPQFDRMKLSIATSKIKAQLDKHGQPESLARLHKLTTPDLPRESVENIAKISKTLAELDGKWGLVHWPQVNPRSIRDKTFLILNKHNQPMHFTDIAGRITDLGQRRREVTVQAVHNELIKDPRFVLVGRGIYALSDWGYTPGTVADIITEVLKQQSPLHKDEIVKRVLQKRQVKTTTIVLNLQEKDQFVRVAKATYGLR
ncbi:MAG TPA: HTH domain-containing protein [Candidatus Saccharimonadales bacterium]|nr:HTH domain-containing protein [Candidatus Saccharimonadales bacterium]